MSEIKVIKKSKIIAEIEGTPDKSITHRAIMLASIAEGKSIIKNYLKSMDCISTIKCFRDLGVDILQEENYLIVNGRGVHGLSKPTSKLDAGNSGTTVRLISGILAGQNFEVEIVGDESLSRRPMRRIIEPLRSMGAIISAKQDNFLPMNILGKQKLKPIYWESFLSSAQVKSCVLLASLYAEGESVYKEVVCSRDHTERIMKFLGIPITIESEKIVVKGKVKKINSFEFTVPNDPSSASFFVAMALLIKNSNLTIRNVCINPTRIGFFNTLSRMGAVISYANQRVIQNEPIADIIVKSSSLRSVKISNEDVPSMIDEIPLLAVVSTQCDGVSEISGAGELRVKESDRISTITNELKKMGAKIVEQKDGMIIMGNTRLKGAVVNSYGDHRIAMSLAVAASIADGETIIKNNECVDISFPDFWRIFKEI